ncbi:MAG: DUF4080 domain-containing protein [Clostridia bacterium]|nr:DUF4080 domain-containing protein [Clostridia bacterium]
MKVISACLNSKYIHSSLSVWCLYAGVKKYCCSDIDIDVMETTINYDNNKFLQEIINKKPDLISFSCYIWNINKTLELCRIIKEQLNCKIVLGGPEVAYRTAQILDNYGFIDFVLTGEGEWAFASLLNAITADCNFSAVEGLSFRNEKKIFINPEIEHNETPPSPYCDKYFEKLSGRIAYIETSRGCPFRCAYCLSGRVSNLRFFDLSQIKTDLFLLAKSGTKTIKFVDRTFNASVHHCNEILTFIKDNFGNSDYKNVCFHFEIAADILHNSTLEILSEMPQGLVQLEIGIQSFNETTLKHINRKSDIKRLIENIKKLISLRNIHVHIDLIAGLSFEDIESFIAGFNKAYLLKADMLQLGFLKLLHGADMREKRQEFPCEFSVDPPYEVISTPWINEDEIFELKRCEDALDRLYNSGRFLLTLGYLIDDIGFTPYELFAQFGKEYDFNNITLTDFVVCLFVYFSKFSDPIILREKICCDLIASSVNITLPEQLKIYDPKYKQLKKYFSEKLNQNIKMVILNSCNKVYIIPENARKNLNGRFEGLYFDIP